MREPEPGLPAGPFDSAIAAYERVRPSYPDPVYDDLVEVLPGPDLVEIGPGTGKATAALLQRGFRVTAVEAGPGMCTFLLAKFAGDPRLTLANARFEDVDLREGAFDGVVAATSFHWIDPAVRVEKSSRLLRQGGVLAVLDTNQIASPVDRGFFERCQPLYVRYGGLDRAQALPDEHDVTPPALAELQGSGRFSNVRLSRYRHDQTCSTADYLDLVRSYSGTQALPVEDREGLLADLGALIEAEFGGTVVRPVVMTLVVGTKLG